MRKRIKDQRGFSLTQVATGVAIAALVIVVSLPILLRIMDNIKDQAIISSLWALFEAQKSYRDAQTPTTYANSLTALVPDYIQDPNRYGYSFNVASVTADAFRIEAKKSDGSGYCIDQNGTLGPIGGCGGGENPPPVEPPPEETNPSCFLSGTPILLANGKTLPIEKINVGDEVMAFDEATKTLKKDKVKTFFIHDADRYLIINHSLKVTQNHPVYFEGKWIEIGKLKVGDNLLDSEGKPLSMTSIQEVREKVKVYNLEVNPYHTYIAGGIVVHNKPDLEHFADPDPCLVPPCS